MPQTLQMITDSERYLLYTLVQTAQADGSVSPVETMFIDNVMRVLLLDEDDRKKVRAMLAGTRETPSVEHATLAADYDTKLSIFKEAIQLAFADGHFHKDEQALIQRLAQRLQLHPGDMQEVWRKATSRFPHTKD